MSRRLRQIFYSSTPDRQSTLAQNHDSARRRPQTATRKTNYIQTDTLRRLCFADRDYRYAQMGPEIRGNRIFINLRSEADRVWPPEAEGWRRQGGIMIRAWNVGSRRGWDSLRRRGANVLATDHVTGREWAAVGADPFAVRGDLETA